MDRHSGEEGTTDCRFAYIFVDIQFISIVDLRIFCISTIYLDCRFARYFVDLPVWKRKSTIFPYESTSIFKVFKNICRFAFFSIKSTIYLDSKIVDLRFFVSI